MLIDAHVHGIHAERDPLGVLLPPLVSIWKNDADPKAMLAENLSYGIEKAVVLDPPEIAFSLKSIFGDFVIAIPKVDIDQVSPEDIETMFSRGARGIKFIAPARSYGDKAYYPLYDVIRAHNGLAVFHTGYLLNVMYEPGGVAARSTYTDITLMRPAALDLIARRFLDLKILMAHFGYPWWDEAACVVRENPNIYADLSGGGAIRKSLGFWKEMFAPDGKNDYHLLEKLCYASDGEVFVPHRCNTRPWMELYNRLYDELKLPQELIERINRANIISLI